MEHNINEYYRFYSSTSDIFIKVFYSERKVMLTGGGWLVTRAWIRALFDGKIILLKQRQNHNP
jgi:hypothetical protein